MNDTLIFSILGGELVAELLMPDRRADEGDMNEIALLIEKRSGMRLWQVIEMIESIPLGRQQ